MVSTDIRPGSAPRAALLVELARRFGEAERLSEEMRAALARTDASTIDGLSAQLETIVLECRILAQEIARVDAGSGESASGPDLDRARGLLEDAARRLARSSAFSSGFLERMVTLRRGLLAIVSSAIGGGYLPTGRIPEPQPEGVRLRRNA